MKDAQTPEGFQDGSLSRRNFAALSLAAGAAVVAGVRPAGAATSTVVEQDVDVKTSAGTCDAALLHPDGKGKWPAVILFPGLLCGAQNGAVHNVGDSGDHRAIEECIIEGGCQNAQCSEITGRSTKRIVHNHPIQPGIRCRRPVDPLPYLTAR